MSCFVKRKNPYLFFKNLSFISVVRHKKPVKKFQYLPNYFDLAHQVFWSRLATTFSVYNFTFKWFPKWNDLILRSPGSSQCSPTLRLSLRGKFLVVPPRWKNPKSWGSSPTTSTAFDHSDISQFLSLSPKSPLPLAFYLCLPPFSRSLISLCASISLAQTPSLSSLPSSLLSLSLSSPPLPIVLSMC